MRSDDLETNPKLDKVFDEIQRQINAMPTPNNFLDIYDYAKRFINEYGVGIRFIEKIYLLGYISGKDGKKENC